ncbi:MAG TPA: hypothetical protein VFG31_10750 [Conexibacter sp.]|nr:hypothetical protein [Conexibacter sp.]
MAWKLGERRLAAMLVLLFVLGAVLVTLALVLVAGRPSTSTRVIAGLLGALAGGLIGATISTLVGRSLNYGPITQVRTMLERTIVSTLTSHEHELSPLRERWHHYHLTIVDGRETWRYTPLPFDRDVAVGSLAADAPVADPLDAEIAHFYRVEAGARGPRVLLTQTSIGSKEAPGIEIFPQVLYDLRQVHAGVAVIHTWDGHDALAPALLSRNRLVPTEIAGSVPACDAAQLSRRWADDFRRVHNLLSSTVLDPPLSTSGAPES